MQVVTSAFCVFNNRNTNLRVAVDRKATGSLAYEITNVVYHPIFNANTKANDLALIQVTSPIRIEGEVQFAAVDDLVLRGGIPVTLEDNHNAVTITNADCRSRVGFAFADLIRDSQICTLSITLPPKLNGRGILRDMDKLAAVPSWSLGNIYVHSRMSFYREWIMEVIAD